MSDKTKYINVTGKNTQKTFEKRQLNCASLCDKMYLNQGDFRNKALYIKVYIVAFEK